ncbi:MAG: thiamine-phosphate kinase [Spirochaetales bacterium]|nr:thiamine-phosphate kinase [Spirochaetales bacterium]
MKLGDLGGEFEFIKHVTSNIGLPPGVVKGAGDDCAVLDYSDSEYLLVTTDMMVENDHFNLKWFSPGQTGWKLSESNVSDILAMGGSPLYAFISMSLLRDTTVEFMDDFYKGLLASFKRHSVTLLGGDTTHGTEYVFNLTLVGKVDKKGIRYRSGAKPGDIICVTGRLGGSTAGLKLLLQGKQGYIDAHVSPRCRTAAEAAAIAGYANAMIDVSDGLASEVTHICRQSGTGARIDRSVIPMSAETLDAAEKTGLDPYDFALYGGEDFELLFTMDPGNIPQLNKKFNDFTAVGEILSADRGIYISVDGENQPLKKGYDHFA